MVNVKRIDHRGHTEFNDLSLDETETLLGEHTNYHVIDSQTKIPIKDLSTIAENQTVILVPIVSGG